MRIRHHGGPWHALDSLGNPFLPSRSGTLTSPRRGYPPVCRLSSLEQLSAGKCWERFISAPCVSSPNGTARGVSSPAGRRKSPPGSYGRTTVPAV